MAIVWSCENDNSDRLSNQLQSIDSLIVLSDNGIDLSSLNLKKEMVFNDSLFLNQITAIEVDSQGNLFLGGKSWNRRQVHIFNSNGSYRDSLGSYGNNFGQFADISRMQWHNNLLYVFDDELNRVTTINTTSGEIVDTVGFNINSNHLPSDWADFQAAPVAISSNGLYLVSFQRYRDPAYESEGDIYFYKVNNRGEVMSGKVLIQQDIQYLVGDYAGRPAPFILPLSEKPLLAISDKEKIYSAYSDEFLIHVQNVDGSTSHFYYYPITRYDLDPNEVIHPRFSHNDQLTRIRESAEYPDKWPALYSLLTDDEERIWVSTITENRDELKWWVIDDSRGKLTATFRWPFEKKIKYVRNGNVYTVEKNNMGFQEVIKYTFDDFNLEKPGIHN